MCFLENTFLLSNEKKFVSINLLGQLSSEVRILRPGNINSRSVTGEYLLCDAFVIVKVKPIGNRTESILEIKSLGGKESKNFLLDFIIFIFYVENEEKKIQII